MRYVFETNKCGAPKVLLEHGDDRDDAAGLALVMTISIKVSLIVVTIVIIMITIMIITLTAVIALRPP